MKNDIQAVYNYEPIFNRTTLDNGTRVVTEAHPHSRAVSIGIFVDLGSRDETPDVAGVTHFIEHLVFKGTKRRTAFEISKSLEQVGGDLNAYTTRETTCFHATCLHADFNMALDVLADLIQGAKMTQRDFDRERMVILQELDMAKDNPEEYGGDLFFEKVYRGHPIADSIAGTSESLQRLKRTQLVEYYQQNYTGSRLIVSAAGAIDHDEVVERVNKVIGKLDKGSGTSKRKKPKFRHFKHFQKRASEQVHLFFGIPSCTFRDPDRFNSYIVNSLLGGGMTSRLYQKVREDHGLVYSIYSFLQAFIDCGLLMLYAGTSPKNAGQVIDIILEEAERLSKNPPGPKEIQMYCTQLKGQILLGAEDMENRMNSLGVNEMVFGEYRPVAQVIHDIKSVNEDSVKKFITKYFRDESFSFLGVGDLEAKAASTLLAKIKTDA